MAQTQEEEVKEPISGAFVKEETSDLRAMWSRYGLGLLVFVILFSFIFPHSSDSNLFWIIPALQTHPGLIQYVKAAILGPCLMILLYLSGDRIQPV